MVGDTRVALEARQASRLRSPWAGLHTGKKQLVKMRATYPLSGFEAHFPLLAANCGQTW